MTKSWADYQPGQVVIEETSQEETVAEAVAAEKADDNLSDESDMDFDDEG